MRFIEFDETEEGTHDESLDGVEIVILDEQGSTEYNMSEPEPILFDPRTNIPQDFETHTRIIKGKFNPSYTLKGRQYPEVQHSDIHITERRLKEGKSGLIIHYSGNLDGLMYRTHQGKPGKLEFEFAKYLLSSADKSGFLDVNFFFVGVPKNWQAYIDKVSYTALETSYDSFVKLGKPTQLKATPIFGSEIRNGVLTSVQGFRYEPLNFLKSKPSH